MHRVVAYIDDHLDQPLDLQTLAAVAYFSGFHFHRLFSAWMGETLGEYLRRRRVEVAAMRLAAQPRMTILNAALSTGFGSAEAFTRAFKSRFGCAPTAWRAQQIAQRRANRNPGQVNSNINQALPPPAAEHDVSRTAITEANMNVKLIERDPVCVAYLRYIGPYGEPISRFWQHTFYPWAVTHNLLNRPRYGISHDDPGVTAPKQCRYDAGVEVEPDFVPTDNVFKTTIAGGRYAALDFRGRVQDIGEAWTALVRDWLPSSGLQLDARPCFEYYSTDAEYDAQTGTFECKICIPVVPL